MKAIILAAGQGTRLRPLTETRPKALMPLAGTNLLEHNIRLVAGCGIRDALVVVDPVGGEMIHEWITSHSNPDVHVELAIQDRPLGTADAIRVCRPLLNEDEPFIVTFSDNVTVFPLRALLDAHSEDRVATLALKPLDTPRTFGIAHVNGDRVLQVEEKPSSPGNLILAGMYIFQPDILDAIDLISHDPSGEFLLPDAIQLLIDRGLSVGYCMCEHWRMNINSPKDLLEANRFLLSTSQYLQERHPSNLIPPVFLPENAEIAESAMIGPSVSLGYGCKIESDATVKDSIFFDNVTVSEGARVSGCILGEGVHVKKDSRIGNSDKPLVVRDHERVESK